MAVKWLSSRGWVRASVAQLDGTSRSTEPLAARESEQPSPASAPGTIYKTDAPVIVDGALDEPCWKDAEVAQNFSLNEGSGPAKAQSRAFVAWDDKNLYVAYRCDEPQMKSLVAKVKERDGRVWEDDCIEIFLLPNRTNPQDFYHVVFNTLGTLRDERANSADRFLLAAVGLGEGHVEEVGE